AGVERMPLWKFTAYTFAGSAIWNAIWIGLGFAFGPTIAPILAQWSGVISTAVPVVIALLLLWFVIARLLRVRRGVRAAAGNAAATEALTNQAAQPAPTQDGTGGH